MNDGTLATVDSVGIDGKGQARVPSPKPRSRDAETASFDILEKREPIPISGTMYSRTVHLPPDTASKFHIIIW